MKPLPVLLAALFLGVGCAQAQRRPIELFLTSGYAQYSQENSYVGRGLVSGGTFSFPIDSGFALEADFHTSRTTFRSKNAPGAPLNWPDLRPRVNFYSVSTIYRLGSERAYGFFGAGPALYTDAEVQSRIVVHLRGGAVFRVARHILLRAEVFFSSLDGEAAVRGVKFGAGYRF